MSDDTPNPYSDYGSPYSTAGVSTQQRDRRAGPRQYGSAQVLKALGPVVYAIRLPDGIIKIGYTGDLAARRRHFTTEPHDILAFMRGTYDDEQAIHAGLVPFRARGHEYYHPTPEVLAIVNEMREDLGLTILTH